MGQKTEDIRTRQIETKISLVGKSSTQAAVLGCGIPAAGVGVGDGPMVGGVCIFQCFLQLSLILFIFSAGYYPPPSGIIL